jgi:surface antigen
MIWRSAAIGLALVLSACSTSGSGPALQAFASNSQPVAARIVDAMAGGLIGGSLGSSLDDRDRRRALEAEYKALEYTPAGQDVTWGRQGGRRYGVVVAGSPYRVGSQDCRQYEHTVTIGGQARTARGTACRNDDGSWTPLI